MASTITRRTLLPILAALPAALAGPAFCAGPRSPKRGASATLAAFGGGPEVPDNGGALRTAVAHLAARGGGVLEIGPGTHRFASAALANRGIAISSGVTIRGVGRDATRLQVTGGAACNLFVAINCSRVTIEDLSIIGNGVASSGSSDGSAAAIRWVLTDVATSNLSGFAVRRVHLENFRGPYWVDIQNLAEGPERLEMHGIVLEDVRFASRPGNSIDPGGVQFNSSAVGINGHGGAVRDVRVVRLAGDARHIKSGIILYQQVIDATLEDIRIADAGRSGAHDDAGAYAIQVYDSFYRMFGVRIINPVITAPRSVGIYVAGATDVVIRGADVSGQSDARSGTLPKGAIVFNGTRRWLVEGGELRGNWRDIDIVTPAEPESSTSSEANGRVEGLVAIGSTTGMSFYRSDAPNPSGVVITNCRWQTRAQTVLLKGGQKPIVRGPDGHPGKAILLRDCQLTAGDGFRAMEIGSDPGLASAEIELSGCTLTGSNPLYARNHAGRLRVVNCTVRDLGTTAGAAAATLLNCANLDLRDSRFESPGRGGVGINLAGSRGSVRGLDLRKSARPLAANTEPSQLGRGRPEFRGLKGQYVQNLDPRPGDVSGWVSEGGARWRGKGRAGD